MTVWVLPASVRALGDQQHVGYDGTGPWVGPAGCGGSFKPGARDLKAYLVRYFPGIRSVGGYNCRPNTANTSETSVHGTGRALDIMIPPVGGDANAAVGDVIANWLVSNAQAIGVQYVLWNNRQWSPSHTPNFRAYTGPDPHENHIHVELNNAGANKQTPFFRGMIDSPPILPGSESVVPMVLGVAGLGALGYAAWKRFGKRGRR